jgi:hypothetical protein
MSAKLAGSRYFTGKGWFGRADAQAWFSPRFATSSGGGGASTAAGAGASPGEWLRCRAVELRRHGKPERDRWWRRARRFEFHGHRVRSEQRGRHR